MNRSRPSPVGRAVPSAPPFAPRPSLLSRITHHASPSPRPRVSTSPRLRVFRPPPPVTICVLTYGDYPRLARRCLESIRRCCDRASYRLVVGANAIGAETTTYLRRLQRAGHIDRLLASRVNLNKCPMMRRLFRRIDTEFIWWFDDDAYITQPGTLTRWLQAARTSPPRTVLWGRGYVCNDTPVFTNLPDVVEFVRTASWYGGLTPPSWKPGGKGEFNFRGQGTGDGRWLFITGGCWLIRSRVIRALDWPDRRLIKLGDDVLLCEALRQQGWQTCDVGPAGIIMHGEPRRGEAGETRFTPVSHLRSQHSEIVGR